MSSYGNVSSVTGDRVNGLYQPTEAFQLGEVVHFPHLFNQAAVERGADVSPFAAGMADSKWSSWTGDPSDAPGTKLKGSDGTESVMLKTTKTAVAVANNYHLEFWYAEKTQTLAGTAAGGYTASDVSNEPQNIFGDIQVTPTTTTPAFPVKGFRYGTPIPSSNYFYKFKAYFVRQVITLGTGTDKKHRYFVMFVPLSNTVKGFSKVLSRKEVVEPQVLAIADAATYDAQFTKGTVEKVIVDAEWLNTNTITDSLRIVLTSTQTYYNGRDETLTFGTAYSVVDGAAETLQTSSVTLNPNVTLATGKIPYHMANIISPFCKISGHLSHVKIANYSVVYRATVRGWVERNAHDGAPNLSQVKIFQVEEPYVSGGIWRALC